MYVYQQPVAGKPGHFKIQICDSVREGKKVRRKIIRSFGVAKSPQEVESVTRFATSELDRELAKARNCELLFDASKQLYEAELKTKTQNLPSLGDVKEEARTVEGFSNIYGTLFDEVVGNVLEEKENEILKEVVLARIAEPASKRRTKEIMERELGFTTSLTSIYRMLDKLYSKQDVINANIFHATHSLVEKVDLLFFDVTTLSFESTDDQGELRKFGYSKDQKFHSTQVVLALATTAQGLPLGYKLFPGNTAETKTLIACIEEWSKFISIERVLFIRTRLQSSSNPRRRTCLLGKANSSCDEQRQGVS